ncbi:hypothetical protein [Curtobacterium sp. VKM Ac-1393]|uniref:hypothetical protein n=1 Tax=Curtobacterium sp. VKM Ac-1393 TaxID=2783814 RepID=UPI00188B75A0|nr:hypothetical protein [Curtobacterium sp. VKM Ac-1393]MBF4607893.1 hypothetical protein [Curtobacterium sp. VKM Ac-1393]
MTELADWETEGAKARPATPDDRNRVPAPAALRATTWIGVLLLVAALFVFVGAAALGLREDETEAHFVARLVIVVVIGAAVAVVGAVALLLRLVAGALVRH